MIRNGRGESCLKVLDIESRKVGVGDDDVGRRLDTFQQVLDNKGAPDIIVDNNVFLSEDRNASWTLADDGRRRHVCSGKAGITVMQNQIKWLVTP